MRVILSTSVVSVNNNTKNDMFTSQSHLIIVLSDKRKKNIMPQIMEQINKKIKLNSRFPVDLVIA
jgi:hypothetical protein